MKIISDRITALKEEKQTIIEEAEHNGSEMQIILGLHLVRISSEINFLKKLLTKLSDTNIDKAFPISDNTVSKTAITINTNNKSKQDAVKYFLNSIA